MQLLIVSEQSSNSMTVTLINMCSFNTESQTLHWALGIHDIVSGLKLLIVKQRSRQVNKSLPWDAMSATISDGYCGWRSLR